MDQSTTLALLALALTLAAGAWLGDRARLRRPLGGLALLPWSALFFTALTVALFMLVHLLSLAGDG